jgi:hypothetical protein
LRASAWKRETKTSLQRTLTSATSDMPLVVSEVGLHHGRARDRLRRRVGSRVLEGCNRALRRTRPAVDPRPRVA